jgi:acetoacetyl-CoA synthetase
MPETRKAYPQDFETVYPLLREHFRNPAVSKEDFRRLFQKHWRSPEDHCGYLLEENGQPVGFLGTIFSLRPVGGRMEHFCNLTAWYVRPEHRSSSLQLILPMLSLKKTTFTNLTASSRVIEVLQKLKFKSLEDRIWFIPPIGYQQASPG